MKTTLFFLLSFVFILSGCSSLPEEKTPRTEYLMRFEDPGNLQTGSLIVNESGQEIGVVTELISKNYEYRQMVEIEESYLKSRTMKFKISVDGRGKTCIVAYEE